MKQLICLGLIAAVATLAGCGEPDNTTTNLSFSGVAPGKDQKLTTAGGPGGSAPPAGYPIPKKADEAPGETAPAADSGSESPALEGPKTGDDTPTTAALSADEIATINKLPAEDAKLALAQATCLISGEPLGSMGVPVKVQHDGKTAFLCCKGCTADFEADPAAAMAKLGKR